MAALLADLDHSAAHHIVAVLAADLPGITPRLLGRLTALLVATPTAAGAVASDPRGYRQTLLGVWRLGPLAAAVGIRADWSGVALSELLRGSGRGRAAGSGTGDHRHRHRLGPDPLARAPAAAAPLTPTPAWARHRLELDIGQTCGQGRMTSGQGRMTATSSSAPIVRRGPVDPTLWRSPAVTTEIGVGTAGRPEVRPTAGDPVGADGSGRGGRHGPEHDAELLQRTVFEVKRIIVGQDRLVERMLVGLLAKGHLLIEGVPGVAKTLAVETFARVVGGTFNRIQFTPDLVPADLLGTRIYRAGREEFDTELGPVVANFVLTDEINRAPAKVQSALLEVMAERHVSIGGITYPMPNPFLVLATQNPIENEGVYPLPEAQRDRFLFKLMVGYPEPDEEREIVYRMGVVPPVAHPVLPVSELIRLQSVAANVFVHHALIDYVVRLVYASRTPAVHGLTEVAAWLSYGASPRASLGIVAAARALALVRGRDFVVPQDVVDVAPDVLRHRLVLSYDALADGIDVEDVLNRLLRAVPLPQVTAFPAGSHPGAA